MYLGVILSTKKKKRGASALSERGFKGFRLGSLIIVTQGIYKAITPSLQVHYILEPKLHLLRP